MAKPISIQQLIGLTAAALALVLLLSALLGYRIFSQYYHTAEARFETNARLALSHGAQVVRSTLDFYQGIVDSMALNPVSIELMTFAETDEIVDWSMSLAKRLPSALGSSFFSAEGKLVGEAEKQRIGPRCLADIKAYTAGKASPYPSIHREVASLEHFDLIAPLGIDKEDPVGLLFVSFRLDRLEQLLQGLSNGSDLHFYLLDASGPVTGTGRAQQTAQPLASFETPIAGTSWRLRVDLPRDDSRGFYLSIGVLMLSSFMLMLLIVSFSLRRLIRATTDDISNIHGSLQQVVQGKYDCSPTPTRLLETRELVSAIAICATQLQKRQRQLERDNSTDPLTGVYNRRYFDLMLEQDFLQSGRKQASYLGLIDLNDFKLINDHCGHATGDEVLKAVALSLLKAVRATDLVARIGGDEFGLLLRNINDEQLDHWARKFCLHFDDTVAHSLPEHDLSLSLSIGIAPISQLRFKTQQALFMAADAAMYQAKENKALGTHYILACPETLASTTGPPP
jgi:diguanylate cyclase (GGDEF)-like protein